MEIDLEGAEFESHGETTQVAKAVEEFRCTSNATAVIPNYGERYRNGERISTGFVESAVNQVISKRFVKKHRQWTPEEHLDRSNQSSQRRPRGNLPGLVSGFPRKTEAKAA
jgi:hypothetical protein